MNKNYCYDKNINGCWLGLCESNFKYIGDFESGSNYQLVSKKLREFYKNQDIDIPTKDELKKLTNLSNTPFDLSKGRPDNPSYYCLYKKNSGYTQTYDLDSGYLKDISSNGYIHPIYRLYNTSTKLSNKEHFLLWIANGLKPKKLNSTAYDIVLKFGLKIDKNFKIENLQI